MLAAGLLIGNRLVPSAGQDRKSISFDNANDSENLTILIPERRADGSLPVSRKSYGLAEGGKLTAQGYDLKRAAFRFEPRKVQGLRDVAQLLTKVSGYGNGFVVRGDGLNPSRSRFQARRFRAAPGRPATLADVPKHLAVLDMDKVPNVQGIDPRTNPEAATEFLLGLMPSSIRGAECIIRWSSSMCVGLNANTAPETLSAHVYVWLDAAVGYKALKDILKGVDAHARAELARVGRHVSRVVDWKVAEPQQPVYVVAPLFGEGLSDPFPGAARQLHLTLDRTPTVSLTTLRKEIEGLAFAGAERAPRKQELLGSKTASNRVGLTKELVTESIRPSRFMLPLRELPALDIGIPEVASIERMTQVAHVFRRKVHGSRISADMAVGRSRAAIELIRVAMARGIWGRDHDAFAEWRQTYGIPDGERDTWLCIIASLLAMACPDDAIRDGTLKRAIHAVGVKLCGSEWMASEWVRGSYDSSIMARARAAADGKTVEWRGQKVDPRYAYGFDRIRADLAIGDDEALALGLLSIAPDWIAAHNRRRADGHKTVLEIREERDAQRQAIKRMHRRGKSVRVIAGDLGLSPTTVTKLLKDKLKVTEKIAFSIAGVGVLPSQVYQTVLTSIIEKREEKSVISACEVPVAQNADFSIREEPVTAVSEAKNADGDKFRVSETEKSQDWIEATVATLRADITRLGKRGASPGNRPSIPSAPTSFDWDSADGEEIRGVLDEADAAWRACRDRQRRNMNAKLAKAERQAFFNNLRAMSENQALAAVSRRVGEISAYWDDLLRKAAKEAMANATTRVVKLRDDPVYRRRLLAKAASLKADRAALRSVGLPIPVVARCAAVMWRAD